MQTDNFDIEKIEKSMQIEIPVEDKGLQTSPREEVLAYNIPPSANDVVPKIASDILSEIVQSLPVKIETQTKETITEVVSTTQRGSQTTPRNETPEIIQDEESPVPVEIHIQTSFVIPEGVDPSIDASTQQKSNVLEIQKSFVFDESTQDFIEENDNKPKSKRKKHKKKTTAASGNSKQPDKKVDIKEEVPCSNEQNLNEPESQSLQPTYATIQITKTTVYETSNIIGKECLQDNSGISIEEITTEDNINEIEPISGSKTKFS